MNTSLRVGFFPAFKGGDVVLLSGTSKDIAEVKSRIEQFADSTAESLDLSAVSAISATHPTNLWLVKSASTARKLNGFALVCSKHNCAGILEMLNTLTSEISGHQYFDLDGGKAQLMVSVGEYDEQWWVCEA